jgi:hypothetical protein
LKVICAGWCLHFSAGPVYAGCKMYGQAEASFSRALDGDPRNFDILYNLGPGATHADTWSVHSLFSKSRCANARKGSIVGTHFPIYALDSNLIQARYSRTALNLGLARTSRGGDSVGSTAL